MLEQHLNQVPTLVQLIYQEQTPLVALAVVSISAVIAICVFEVAHSSFLRRLKHYEGLNDAISGALGAIGVLYGVTVGLVAIDAWQRRSEAENIVAQEAAAIQVLYLSVMRNGSIGLRDNPDQLVGAKPLPYNNWTIRKTA